MAIAPSDSAFSSSTPEWLKAKDSGSNPFDTAPSADIDPFEASSNPFGIGVMSSDRSNPFAEDRAIVRRDVDFGVIENAFQGLERFYTNTTRKIYHGAKIAKEFTIGKVLPAIVALGFLYIAIKLSDSD
jgi:hypothetical protein